MIWFISKSQFVSIPMLLLLFSVINKWQVVKLNTSESPQTLPMTAYILDNGYGCIRADYDHPTLLFIREFKCKTLRTWGNKRDVLQSLTTINLRDEGDLRKCPKLLGLTTLIMRWTDEIDYALRPLKEKRVRSRHVHNHSREKTIDIPSIITCLETIST